MSISTTHTHRPQTHHIEREAPPRDVELEIYDNGSVDTAAMVVDEDENDIEIIEDDDENLDVVFDESGNPTEPELYIDNAEEEEPFFQIEASDQVNS